MNASRIDFVQVLRHRSTRRGLGLISALAVLLCAGQLCLSAADAAGTGHPVLTGPKVNRHSVLGWPFKTLALGVEAHLGSAITPQETGRVGLRYAFLAGGVNTGQGWGNWSGAVPQYISDSEAAGIVPVFTYYQIEQSRPGVSASTECGQDLENLKDASTMAAYYADLKLFFQKAAGASGPVVLEVEPDLWGCIERASSDNANNGPVAGSAASVPAAVAASGVADVSRLANNAAGFAQAIVALRNTYAPHVQLGYAESYWGSDIDLQLNHPSDAQVQAMAAANIGFYRTLNANFDVIFSQTHDRDAGYSQAVDGAGTSHWWTPTDFQHLGSYVGDWHQALGLPVVIWGIPTGTTGMNNTPGNYADNQVQSLLGSGSAARALLKSYAADGVAALLFGPSMTTDTQITGGLLDTFGTYDRLGPLPVS